MDDTTSQRRSEVRALAQLVLEEIGGAAAGIGKAHRAVSDRLFAGVQRGVGPAALPVKLLHDAIADGAYAAIDGTARMSGRIAGQALDVLHTDVRFTDIPLSETRRGGLLMGVIAGFIGDVLESESSPIVGPMAVRVNGAALSLDADTLAATFPDASGRLVVFLHGLVETEASWGIGGNPTYGDRLEPALGCTQIQIRYNSGRHISDNGRSLADLLDALVTDWPVEVEEIALVGHSMGGLISRSACHLAQGDEMDWVNLVRHVVCLGSPHLGAPLEQFVHYASAALDVLPETRPFGRLLRRRSAGIRDLNQGSLVDEDWRGRDPDALAVEASQEIPLLDDAMYFFVSGSITRSPRHPLGRFIGDGLVLTPSASGKNRRRLIGFEEENGIHVPGANHFALLNHDVVYEKLLVWLQMKPAP